MHELRRLVAREWRERERERVRLAASPAGASREQLRAGRGDDEQRHARRPVDEMVDEVEQAFVGPVEILEDEDERALVGDPLEEAPPGGERLLLVVAPAARVLDARQWAEMADRPFDVVGRQGRRDRSHRSFRSASSFAVRLEDAGVRLDHLPERPEADPLAVGQ